MKEHKTKKIAIKMADVDVKMIPLVKWLNSFEGVHTLYCCEGHKSSPWNAYVVFTCSEPFSLMGILKKFYSNEEAQRCTVEYYEGLIRYCMRFLTRDTLSEFTKGIKRGR